MEGARKLRETHAAVKMFLDQEDEESVYWVQRGGRDNDALSLHSAPINVADRLRDSMFGKGPHLRDDQCHAQRGGGRHELLPQAHRCREIQGRADR